MNLESQFNQLQILINYQTHPKKKIISKLQLTHDIYNIANTSFDCHRSKVFQIFKIRKEFYLWFHQKVLKVYLIGSSKLLIKNLAMIFAFIKMIIIVLKKIKFNCNKTNLFLFKILSTYQSLKILIFKRKRVSLKVSKTTLWNCVYYEKVKKKFFENIKEILKT